MTQIKILMLFLTFVTIRPSALGDNYTSLGLIFCSFALLIFIIEKINNNKIKISREYIRVVFLVFLYWMYIIVQATFTNSPMTLDLLKGFVTTLFITLVFSLTLSEQNIQQKLMRLIIRVMIILIYSYLITMFLTNFIPIENLIFFEFYIDTNIKNVLLPFTPIYGTMTVDGYVFQRFLGIFKESGISQAFMVWAYVSLKHYNMNKLRNRIILMIGIVITFSTAGIAVFISTIALKLFLEGKKVIALVVLPIIYLGLMYAPFVGLADKFETHGTSITDRTSSMETSLQLIYDNPFGVGLGNSPIQNFGGINLISSFHMIGVIGILLLILIYFLNILYLKNRKDYLVSIFPLFLTALFSQPIADTPLMFMMVLVCLGNSQKYQVHSIDHINNSTKVSSQVKIHSELRN